MWQLSFKVTKYFIFFLLITVFLPACDRLNDSPIPDVYVSFTVNLNISNELNVPGNALFFPGAGFGGVIVSSNAFGEFYAFDATCTHEASNSCRVLKDENFKNCSPCLFENLILECSCCGSQFSKIDGTVLKGPAAKHLKHYRVSMMNSFTLRVYN